MSTVENSTSPVIVMGASAGGVQAILRLAAALAPGFPAPILLAHHIGVQRSEFWKLVSQRGPNPASHPHDGEEPAPGHIYIAPPDHHMLIEQGRIRLSRGPKEHHARPAIDPLFRSAALDLGPRAVGVVLTGMLNDGAAGLRAIKECGGLAIVQDPDDAQEPSMPMEAIAATRPDHVVPLSALADLLGRLAAQPRPARTAPPPDWLRLEHVVTTGAREMEKLKVIGTPSGFVCPDCGGALFELNDKRPVRYRCHTGHAFSLLSLAHLAEEMTDSALWTGVRALQEKEAILRRLAQASQDTNAKLSEQALAEADELASLAAHLLKLTGEAPTPISFSG